MAKEAFLPLFFGDLLASTGEWEGEEVSLYLTIMGHQWSLGSLPPEPEKIRRLVRWNPKNFASAWPQVSEKFVARADGRLVNLRLEEHRAKASELSKKNANSGRKGAMARWGSGGERHKNASGKNIAAAQERHESANSVTHGNPSHPIPSHEEKTQERAGDESVPESREPTTLGAVCLAVKAEGIMDVNPSYQPLLDLLAEGAGLEEFVQAAREAVPKGKGFAYVIGTVVGRRKDAAQTKPTGMRGPLKPAEPPRRILPDAFDVARRQRGEG